MTQLSMFRTASPVAGERTDLSSLLDGDLDFHGKSSSHTTHALHAFPAKFPPQLPLAFILGLTDPGDVVLDPMAGSGTTIVEAYRTSRRAIAFDIDPLALLLISVKTTPLNPLVVIETGQRVIERARARLDRNSMSVDRALGSRWDAKSRDFVDYWFAPQTQRELAALVMAIEEVREPDVRSFLELVLSSIIITKTGGVSLAFDLAHTRPHRAKIVKTTAGEVILGQELVGNESPRIELLTKTLRSPLEEYGRRLRTNAESVIQASSGLHTPVVQQADAQEMPLEDASVDLIVTSPPYAGNAIDYMRAHKFSLVWLGHEIPDLGRKRGEYIGGETTKGFPFVETPGHVEGVIARMGEIDPRKGAVLRRYYTEMSHVLREMHRVLRPGRSSIVVVGNSILRGMDTEIPRCLCEIGRQVGFCEPEIGVRHLDRDRRMMPAGMRVDTDSQIQQRMHEEYVIGFTRPAATLHDPED